jgi:hypothetical protein
MARTTGTRHAKRAKGVLSNVTPDDVITAITKAATEDDALAVMDGIRSRALLLAVADQLYIDDPNGHGNPWLRNAIVKEARS